MSPQTLNSEVPFDPSGSPAFLQNNLARFAFSQLLCFPIFHRSFAATGWPEKHSSPFETTSNAWEVFYSYFLSQYSSPFSTWNVSAKSLWISGLFRFVCRSNAFLVFSLQKLFPFLGTFFQKKHSTSSFNSFPCPVWWKGYLLKISLLFKRPFPGRKLIGWLLENILLKPIPPALENSLAYWAFLFHRFGKSFVPLTSGLCEAAVKTFNRFLYLLSMAIVYPLFPILSIVIFKIF